jgi:hypothetical protein
MVNPVKGSEKIGQAEKDACLECLLRAFVVKGKEKRDKGDP